MSDWVFLHLLTWLLHKLKVIDTKLQSNNPLVYRRKQLYKNIWMHTLSWFFFLRGRKKILVWFFLDGVSWEYLRLQFGVISLWQCVWWVKNCACVHVRRTEWRLSRGRCDVDGPQITHGQNREEQSLSRILTVDRRFRQLLGLLLVYFLKAFLEDFGSISVICSAGPEKNRDLCNWMFDDFINKILRNLPYHLLPFGIRTDVLKYCLPALICCNKLVATKGATNSAAF